MTDLLRQLARQRRGQVLVGLALVVAGCLQLSTLTNHLSYASALVGALTGCFAAMLWGALVGNFVREIPDPSRAVSAGTVLALAGVPATFWLGLLAGITALVGALRAPCGSSQGGLFWLLIALPGVWLAAVWGTVCGALFSKLRTASRVSLWTLPAFVIWSVIRFYQTPTVFAYDPFFGFWPGVLYDETITASSTLLSYRFGTLAWVVALSALFVASWDVSKRRLGRPHSVPAMVTFGAAITVALGVYLAGPTLGHRASAQDIASALGGRIDGARCVLIHARSIDRYEARLHHRDCELRVQQLERYFGVQMDRPITAYIFESAAQKQRWMGAANTFIAKPWRAEVYLQHEPSPHTVLKHELAHVVAGRLARGPFFVTSQWRLIPLPGLIEGAAVAAAWESDGDASPHEWSHALLDANLVPPLESIVGNGFYAHGSSKAYTIVGSFVRWIVSTHGLTKFRALYVDGDFERAYGLSLGTLTNQWQAFLRTVSVPARIQERVRARFAHAALFARACPNETAEQVESASELLARDEASSARPLLERAIVNDPTSNHARTLLAVAWARDGRLDRANSVADEAARSLGPSAAARGYGRIADMVWRWQGPDAARPLYQRVRADLFDDDEARTLEVRQWAVGLIGSPPTALASEAARDLLVGRDTLSSDATSAVARFSEQSWAEPHASMIRYLVARQLWRNRRDAPALRMLNTIDPANLPTERVRAEVVRIRAECLYWLDQLDSSRALYAQIAADPSRPTGPRDQARDWVDRIDLRRTIAPRPR
ncbi:MAG: ABC transporter permease [Deltaproteobacteria bacterium]|nr:ABC transporter permease [Deltaproteobacteria bacterium]